MRRSRGSLRWLMGLIATSALFVGGCSSGGSTTATSTNLEIFTYWTAGGEADGLAAIESIFNKNYPGIKVTNAVVAGGAGSNAAAVLATRMAGGNPPHTFQIHRGARADLHLGENRDLQP